MVRQKLKIKKTEINRKRGGERGKFIMNHGYD